MWLLLLPHVGLAAPELLKLHADNFDRVVSQHQYVLVHFWMPGTFHSTTPHSTLLE